ILVFTVLHHLYSFILSDHLPWLRPLDLEGHEKIVSEAMKVLNGYNDPLIDKRVKEWKDGKRKEPEDLLDAFILAKDSEGKPALSVEEIKAQCTEMMFATLDNPSNAAEWAMAEMINQPEILQKATEEIERVVGNQRWDIPRLNYPCFVSRLGLGRNPKVWDEPLGFKPERHLKDGCIEEVDLTETELRFISFSTGRRGCMGVALGSAMTVMVLARLIQGFSWRVPSNEANIDLSVSENDLFMAKPLHAMAKPRLPGQQLYPPY
ncbi:hypothetical protein Golob_011321, partial [Gossypium lobatum]|nr:hypothetical protein [Gossypium lobatum]